MQTLSSGVLTVNHLAVETPFKAGSALVAGPASFVGTSWFDRRRWVPSNETDFGKVQLMTQAPVIVIGLGGIGSAALASIARRGVPVLGIDRFSPPHDRGSSHGGSRIVRAAYFEHPDYVPLARESLERWARLESETGRRCLHRCGVLLTGGPESEVLGESASAAAKHGIAAEEIDPDALRRR